MIPGLPSRPRVADLRGQTLTLEQMRFLGTQHSLVGLQLDDCPIGDDHVAAICKLPRLVNLSLANTRITDAGLACLGQLPKLYLLVVDDTQVTGEGLRGLAAAPKLETLWMCRTRINDDTIELAATMPKLDVLRIAETAVTFDGIMKLVGNKRIKVVADGQFSDAQIAQFEAAQRDIAGRKRGTTKPAPDVETEARELVEGFFKAMNQWETARNKAGLSLSAKAEAAFEAQCQQILATYCTEAIVKKGRGHYGHPPAHANETIVEVEQETRNKLWVYTKPRHLGPNRYLVVKKENGWRIDKAQTKYGTWSPGWL